MSRLCWFWEGPRGLSGSLEGEADLALLGRLAPGEEIERQIAKARKSACS